MKPGQTVIMQVAVTRTEDGYTAEYDGHTGQHASLAWAVSRAIAASERPPAKLKAADETLYRNALHPEFIVNLTRKEFDMLKSWAGGQTFEEVGLPFGLSRERVRQIKLKTERKIKWMSSRVRSESKYPEENGNWADFDWRSRERVKAALAEFEPMHK